MQVKTELETVGPQEASRYLAMNLHNRPLRKRAVDKYAKEMREGRWQLTHQGAAISKSNVLLDGQHKLAAVVQSGIAVSMFITRGLPDSTFSVIDAGTRRTAGDTLQTAGYSNYTHLAAALRILYVAEMMPDHKMWQGSATVVPNDLILELAEKHPEAEEWVTVGARVSKALRTPTAIMCGSILFLAQYGSSEWVHEFANGLANGENLTGGSPILLCRNWLIRRRELPSARRGAEYDQRSTAGIIVKSWNKWVAGETIARIRFAVNESFPTPARVL